MEWKYVKPLTDKTVVEEFEKAMSYAFPSDFTSCVLANNGGRPAMRSFNTDKASGRAVKSFLSFNKDDKETVWKIYEWNKEVFEGKYIPFAIDNFGNVICFDYNNTVVFYEHETGKIEHIADDFTSFMGKLYKS